MRRRILIVGMACVAVFGLILAANWQVVSMFTSGPYMGGISESWETSNRTFRLRIDRRTEENAWVGGAYYVFQSAPSGSESWHEIMTFRHDDPNPIPHDQVRFLDDQVAFVFMGWMYSVTTDGGRSWSVWNAEKDLPKWDCCNYRLISSVNIEPNGTGTMILNPIPQRQGGAPELHTKDFGQHWSL